jgi:ABC-type sugar transport system substrate-binding protein
MVLCLAGCGGKPAHRPFTLGFMPKLVGIPYFNACERGAKEAAEELGMKLVYNGPTKADSNQQNDLLSQWIHSGEFDCIAVACNDPDLVAPYLREARQKGIWVITFDADSQPDARQFFVNQATYEDVAHAMADAMAEELEPKGTGKVGILTSSIQAPNQSQWASRLKAHVRKTYPALELLPETQHGEDRDLGISKAKDLIQANPDLKGIIGLTSVAVPAAAEAVRQEGKRGKIKVTGVSTPKDMRDYVQDGTVKTVILWNPVDLGFLTVYVAEFMRHGTMPENGTIQAGRLGPITVRDREVLLGKPLRFDRANIDAFDF